MSVIGVILMIFIFVCVLLIAWTLFTKPLGMTREEFMAVLRNTERTWFLGCLHESSGEIRIVQEGTRKDFDCLVTVVPITAVCQRVTGEEIRLSSNWKKSAKELGLDENFARDVAAATDGEIGHDKKVRQELLEATSITNPN